MSRACITCDKDLTDVMAVHVFVNDSTRSTHLRRTDLFMCIEHGGNGGNVLSQAEYAQHAETYETPAEVASVIEAVIHNTIERAGHSRLEELTHTQLVDLVNTLHAWSIRVR